jgi:uncharacterized membrane protein
MSGRFWEIDLLRGVAILSMIVFHLLWDIEYLGLGEIELYSGGLFFFAHAIGTTFLLLVGISLSLSHSRVEGRMEPLEIWRKYLLRGLRIFSLGILISVITWLLLGDGFVLFGVLHCIGLSIILAIPLLRLGSINILLGSLLVLVGVGLSQVVVDTQWLLWLGLRSGSFVSVDYFPLLPWFGVVLLGLGAGNIIYPRYRSRSRFPDLGESPLVRPFCFMGRNSLMIYLVHQPLLILIMTIVILAGL